ncbi:MAG: YGGT family protein [Alphaproteobacteria bacterium ADurb.Bin438]|nr:MAG: YGGT family protein [Alphaproteobacteria bacterium ADurb.Bin438]
MDVLLVPILEIMVMIINLYLNVIFIAVVISWLVGFGIINTSNQFVFMVVKFFKGLTEPAFRKIDEFIPAMGGMSLSPVVLIFGCIFVKQVLIRLIFKFS